MLTLRKLLPWGFALFGFLLPVQLGKHFWPDSSLIHGLRVDYLSPTLYLTYLLLALLVVCTVARYNKPLISILILLGIGIFPLSALSLYRASQYLAIILTALLIAHATEKERKMFLYGLAASSIYQLVLVVQQLHAQGSIQGLWWWLGERRYAAQTPGIARVSFQGYSLVRPYGTFSHPNSMAGFYLCAALLLFYAKRPLLALGSIFLVLLSCSRLAIAGLALGLLIVAIGSSGQCMVCRIGKILLANWIALMALIPIGSQTSWSDRVTTWQAGWNSFTAHLWQWPALGTYIYSGRNVSATLFHQPIHNAFLIVLVEWRIAGAIMLSILMLWLYKKIPLVLSLPLVLVAFFDHYLLTLVQNMLLLGVVIGWGMWRGTNEKTSHAGVALEQ